MIRSSLSLSFSLSLLFSKPVLAQTQINPNQIARGNAYTTLSPALAVSFCASKPGCEWHINGTAAVSSSVTLPSNITLFFEGGGQLAIASGVTVTINGSVKAAPDTQVFSGAGVVRNLRFVSPGWFGVSYSLDQLVATLQDVAGATIGPWTGSMLSSGSQITRGHLVIQGRGMLPFAADHSKFDGPGSIIQGKILLNIPDLQVDGVNSDMGSYQAAHGGYCTGDASGNFLDIAPSGNTPSTIQVTHFATLGCSPTTAAHSVLIENFDGVVAEHIRTWYNSRGFISKSSHVVGADIETHENAGECFIVKSDSTEGGGAVTSNHFREVKCVNSSSSIGGSVNIFADQAVLKDIMIDSLTMVNEGVLDIEGYAVPNGTAISEVTITNLYNSGSAGRGVYLGAYMGHINLINPTVINSASDGIWFVGGPVNITNPQIINPGSHNGIVEVNGGAGVVLGGRCVQASGACVVSSIGPVFVSGVFSENTLTSGAGISQVTSPFTSNGNFMVGASDDLTNYYFGNGDVRQDKSIGVTGFNSAQINLRNTGTTIPNQHRFQAIESETGFSMRFLNDLGTDPHDFFGCSRSGNAPTGCSIPVPLAVPSIAPANGLTAIKTAGACQLTITSGIITAVSGC